MDPSKTLATCAALARQLASPLAMFNLGTVLLNAGDAASAEAWYREALALDPAMVEANHNLAAILEDSGRTAEAQTHRAIALRRRRLHVETATEERRRVLVLCAGGYGNTPIEHLLPRRTTTRLKLFVEYTDDADWVDLPLGDVVFNAIGDADLAPCDSKLRTHLATRRVLNHPDRVARTRRDSLPDMLAGLDGVVVPRVLRLDPGDAVGGRLHGRVLVRPIGAHGGNGVVLTDTPMPTTHPSYVTEYHDYRSADGMFRKYRMIFVNGRAYPYHLAISSDWLVHYFSADMAEAAWKRAEEAQFLARPDVALGANAIDSIHEIGIRLGLDYGGVDFGMLSDGRVLVFEANATMLVYPDDDTIVFDYRQDPVARILAAFDDMLGSA